MCLGATCGSQTRIQEDVGPGCAFVKGNCVRPGSLIPPSLPPSVSDHLTTGGVAVQASTASEHPQIPWGEVTEGHQC